GTHRDLRQRQASPVHYRGAQLAARMIHAGIQESLQIWIVVMAFLSPSGDRYLERMPYAFTTEAKCEEFARPVLKSHYQRIPGLYWYCQNVPVNP
ncbi:MAG: hypothetical protein V3W44_04995, partial [Dehalococcoidales bacterium]